MTIWNLGSINADMVYAVPHLPGPGETLAATGFSRFLGGKGANMSVAAARAGARVVHVGAVGEDGAWAIERLAAYGVDTRHVGRAPAATGHAVIAVDPGGENQILLYQGANHAIPADRIRQALDEAAPGDRLLMQNETNGQRVAAEQAAGSGLRICYAAAPFEAAAVRAILPFLDLLVLNAVEANQLTRETGMEPGALPVADVVVTLGAQGARHFDTVLGENRHYPAIEVAAVDTTGAGDCFSGYLVAALDRGRSMPEAIGLAMRAAAIMVTRHGTADVIPTLDEVESMPIGSP